MEATHANVNHVCPACKSTWLMHPPMTLAEHLLPVLPQIEERKASRIHKCMCGASFGHEEDLADHILEKEEEFS